MGRSSNRRRQRKKALQLKNDTSEGKKQLPPKDVEEGSSSDKDSLDSKDQVMVQNLAAHASKNDESNINFDEDDEELVSQMLMPAVVNTIGVPKPNSIIVGNLSHTVDENQLWSFFQGVGVIVEIRLAAFDDGTCKGFAEVEFAKPESVYEACKLNGSILMGKPVSLNFGHRQQLTIGSGSSSSPSKPDDYSDDTILIRGFDTVYGWSEIRRLAREHFSTCGEIEKVLVIVDDETEASIGTMFMEFSDQNSVFKALQLNGSILCGFCLHVEKALSSGGRHGGGGAGHGGGGRGGGVGRHGGGRHGGGGHGGCGVGRHGGGGTWYVVLDMVVVVGAVVRQSVVYIIRKLTALHG